MSTMTHQRSDARSHEDVESLIPFKTETGTRDGRGSYAMWEV